MSSLSSSSLVFIPCEIILWHIDKLSQTLQQPTLSGVEGHEVAMLTVKTLQHLRTDDNFDLFWQKVEKMRYQFNIAEPQLARKQKAPKRYEQGSAPAEIAESPKINIARCILKLLTLL